MCTCKYTTDCTAHGGKAFCHSPSSRFWDFTSLYGTQNFNFLGNSTGYFGWRALVTCYNCLYSGVTSCSPRKYLTMWADSWCFAVTHQRWSSVTTTRRKKEDTETIHGPDCSSVWHCWFHQLQLGRTFRKLWWNFELVVILSQFIMSESFCQIRLLVLHRSIHLLLLSASVMSHIFSSLSS